MLSSTKPSWSNSSFLFLSHLLSQTIPPLLSPFSLSLSFLSLSLTHSPHFPSFSTIPLSLTRLAFFLHITFTCCFTSPSQSQPILLSRNHKVSQNIIFLSPSVSTPRILSLSYSQFFHLCRLLSLPNRPLFLFLVHAIFGIKILSLE